MYFISRIYPLVLMSKTVLGVMLIIGLISAFVSAFIAMSQDNIKKILMYLMVSQFGVALSLFALGAYSVANRFTLIVVVAMTLLCVVGGYVVRCAGKEENIKMLGGLKHHLPVCAVVFGIASAFLIGCNFMQRNILTLLYQVGNEFIFWGYLCVLFLMVYSLARVYFLIFCGVKKEDFAIDKTSKIMFVPIAVLIMFLIGLFVLVSKFDDFIYFITPEKSVSVGIVPLVLGGFVIFGAVYISAMLYCAPYNVFTKVKERVLSRENFLYKLSYNELYYREICAWGGSKIFLPLCKAIDFVEKNVVESLISVIVLTTKFFVSIVSKIYDKNGKNSFLFAIVLLAVVVIVIAGLYVIGSLMGV